jgi:hypothetical protein
LGAKKLGAIAVSTYEYREIDRHTQFLGRNAENLKMVSGLLLSRPKPDVNRVFKFPGTPS